MRRHYSLNVVVTHLSQSQPPSHNVAAMAGRHFPSEKPVHSEKVEESSLYIIKMYFMKLRKPLVGST